MADKKLIASLEIDTGRSKQNLTELQDALANSGGAGARSASEITRALENIEAGEEKVNRKISEGRTVTERDGKVMIQQFALLEAQIRETFGTLDKAPAEMQDAFKKAEQQVDRTKAKVRELTDAVDDQKGQLKEGGEQWTGLGVAINHALGPMGSIQAKVGLVTAALLEGWNIGMRFNRMFGTDMSLWDEAVGRFGQKVNLVVRDISDGVAAAWGLIQAILDRSPSEAKKALAEISAANEKSLKDLGAVISKTGNEWDAYAAKQGLNTKLATEQRQAAADLAEAKARLRKEIEDTAKALKAETDELDKQKKVAQESKNQIIDNTATQFYLGVTLEAATAKLEHQKQVVELLTKQYGENNGMTQQAVAEMQRLQAQVDELKRRYDETGAAVQHYTEENKKANESVDEHSKKIAELRKQHASLEEAVVKAAASVTGATATTHQAAAASGAAAQQVTGWYDAQGKLHISNVETAASTDKAREAAEKAGHAAEAASGSVRGWIDAEGRVHITNEQTATSADKAASSTRDLATAAQTAGAAAGQVADATAKAAPAIADYATQMNAALGPMREMASLLSQIVGQLRDTITLAHGAAEAFGKLGEAAAEAAGNGSAPSAPASSSAGASTTSQSNSKKTNPR